MKTLETLASGLYFLCLDIQKEFIPLFDALKESNYRTSLIIDATKQVLSLCEDYKQEAFRSLIIEDSLRRGEYVTSQVYTEEIKHAIECLSNIKDTLYFLQYTLYLTSKHSPKVEFPLDSFSITNTFINKINELIEDEN